MAAEFRNKWQKFRILKFLKFNKELKKGSRTQLQFLDKLRNHRLLLKALKVLKMCYLAS